MANRRQRRRAAAAARRERDAAPEPSTAPEAPDLDQLFAIAAEPVPLGSGTTAYGAGPYWYVKSNSVDGSARLFRFARREDCQRAMAPGMASDRVAEEPPVTGWPM